MVKRGRKNFEEKLFEDKRGEFNWVPSENRKKIYQGIFGILSPIIILILFLFGFAIVNNIGNLLGKIVIGAVLAGSLLAIYLLIASKPDTKATVIYWFGAFILFATLAVFLYFIVQGFNLPDSALDIEQKPNIFDLAFNYVAVSENEVVSAIYSKEEFAGVEIKKVAPVQKFLLMLGITEWGDTPQQTTGNIFSDFWLALSDWASGETSENPATSSLSLDRRMAQSFFGFIAPVLPKDLETSLLKRHLIAAPSTAEKLIFGPMKWVGGKAWWLLIGYNYSFIGILGHFIYFLLVGYLAGIAFYFFLIFLFNNTSFITRDSFIFKITDGIRQKNLISGTPSSFINFVIMPLIFAILFAFFMCVPILNRLIEICTLQILAGFLPEPAEFLVRVGLTSFAFCISFFIPTWWQSYQNYKQQQKIREAQMAAAGSAAYLKAIAKGAGILPPGS